MPDNLFLWPIAGFIIAATFGVLFARRMATAAFSLFAMLLGIAALYAYFDAHYAVVTQVVLYVGGIMVLIIFALFLYNDPPEAPKWNQFRENFGKAFFLILLSGIAMFFLPWDSLSDLTVNQPKGAILPKQDIATTGQILASRFAVEFELLGILLLASIIVAGWFIKSQTETMKP